jgi:hypothetical protein
VSSEFKSAIPHPKFGGSTRVVALLGKIVGGRVTMKPRRQELID